MASETVVRYNGVTLNDVQTVAWSETAVYDESGTDILYVEYTATFAGIVTDGAINVASPYTDDGNSATVVGRLNSIRKYMLQPRAALTVTCNGVTILSVPAAPANGVANTQQYDVQNGPKPIDFQVVNVWGGKVFRVLWSVKTCLHRFCSPNQRIEVLNNRWEVSESIDSLKYITRTINGELKLASYASVPAMGYKSLVVPPLETGFRRESIDYDVSADGLTCRYSVTDKQVEVAAPWPAASMELTHTESTNNGITLFSAARCSLVGQPNAMPAHLVQRGVELVEKRLQIAGKIGTYLIQNSSITVIFGQNITVQVELSIQRTPAENQQESEANLAMSRGVTMRVIQGKEMLGLQAIDGIPNSRYQADTSVPTSIWGYDVRASAVGNNQERIRSAAAAAVFRVYLQEPCGVHGITDNTPRNNQTGGAAKSTQAGSGGVVLNPNTNLQPLGRGNPLVYSEESFKNIYIEAQVYDEWNDEDMVVALPIADTESRDGTAFGRIAKRQSKRTIDYTAKRVDVPPQIPDLPETYEEGEGANKVTGHRIRFRRKLESGKPSPNGETLIYTLTQWAEYAFSGPLSDDTKRSITKQPIVAGNPNVPDSIVVKDQVNKNIGIFGLIGYTV